MEGVENEELGEKRSKEVLTRTKTLVRKGIITFEKSIQDGKGGTHHGRERAP